MEDCGVLRKLDAELFRAENGDDIDGIDWETYLRRTLADSFIIRRSDPRTPDQTREEMIRWIRERRVVRVPPQESEVVCWCEGSLGVVLSPVKVVNTSGGRLFRNVKVFRRSSDGLWVCLYWQVTEAPLDRV